MVVVVVSRGERGLELAFALFFANSNPPHLSLFSRTPDQKEGGKNYQNRNSGTAMHS